MHFHTEVSGRAHSFTPEWTAGHAIGRLTSHLACRGCTPRWVRDIPPSVRRDVRSRPISDSGVMGPRRRGTAPCRCVRALTAASVCASLLAASIASAQATVDERVEIGRPVRTVRIAIAPASDRVRLEVSGRTEEVELGLTPTTASLERVALAGGGAIAVLRASDGTHEIALVIGADRHHATVLHRGSLSWSGDPGERTRDVVEVADRTGDGTPDVVVAVELEAARICGQDRTLLDTRAVDPRSLELRPVELRRLPRDGPEVELTASRSSPGPTGPPVLRALAFSAASSTVGQAGDAASRSPPLALGDSDPETWWAEGRAGAGRWEFATGHFVATLETRAIAITMPPALRGLSMPIHLFLVGDSGPRLRVTIPADAQPGEKLWVTPPAGTSWRCLSIVLDDARDDTAATALGDVDVYTELDFGDGVGALVAELVSDSDAGSRAADVLRRLGSAGVAATLEAWPTLTPTGKRRAIRVFAAHPEDEGAARALAEGARDADADVAEAAVAALVAAGESARPVLSNLARSATAAGNRAAAALAESAPDAAAEPILAAMGAAGGSERPALRTALRVVARRGSSAARQRIDAWAREAAPSAAVAAALALGSVDVTRSIASRLVGAALPSATRFEDRWRLVAALAELDAEPPGDAWLAELASGAEEWMLRAAAIESLAHRRSARAVDVARGALANPYPRVRATAVRALGERGEATGELARLAGSDAWPLVRASAVEAIARAAGARDVVRRALDDDAKGVRAAALRALTLRRDRGVLAAVGARMQDEDEWPEVLVEAIAYARALCTAELVEALAGVVRRGMRPNAWAPDVDVAVRAVEALASIGGDDADAVVRRAQSEVAPAALRIAAARAQALSHGCSR